MEGDVAIYGKWWYQIDRQNQTVFLTVCQRLSCMSCGVTADEATDRYITSINRALPKGVYLKNDTFYGPQGYTPWYSAGYPVTRWGDLDLAKIVARIDFWDAIGVKSKKEIK